jgi:nitroreductase
MFGLAHKVFKSSGKPNTYALHDLGLATAHLILEGESLGLRTHAMAGILPDRIREVFGVPEEFEPVTALAIGRPGDPESLPEPLLAREKAPRERKSLDQIAFGGQFGKPFADKGL